jgi:hypothetical protein
MASKIARIAGYAALVPVGFVGSFIILAAAGGTLVNNKTEATSNLERGFYNVAIAMTYGVCAGIAITSPVLLVRTIMEL